MNKLWPRIVSLLSALAIGGCASVDAWRSAPPAEPTPAVTASTAAMPAQEDPADGPLPPEEALPKRIPIKDAVLGPGDQIQVRVYRHADLNTSAVVPASGTIFVPLAGEIDVTGISGAELRRVLTRRLDQYVVDPQVSVIVELQRSEKILVLGEVRSPGVFVMEAPITALEGIARAGGFTNDATKRRVILLRPQPDRLASMILNLERTLTSADIEQNPTLRRGDVLFVPKSTVTNIDRFARHLTTWISPIISAESAILLGYSVDDRISNTGIFIGQ